MQYEKDLKSEHKELFLEARKYLLSFKGIIETKKERITTYSNSKGGICHMRTMPYGIDFGFLKGAKMQDDLGLLTGKGKTIRTLPLKKLNKKEVEYYLKQAIKINSKHKPKEDLYGNALLDYQKGNYTEDIITNSTFEKNGVYSLPYLFRDFKNMPLLEQKALALADGKILDIGCGSGSHSLYLQEKNNEVLAIDISKGAIKTCKLRGIRDAKIQDIWKLKNQKFDTILLLMNGAGMCGKLEKLPDFFNHLKTLLTPNGQILLDSTDVIYMFEDEDGNYIIDANKSYYGETQFEMNYKGQKGKPFNWLYIDFNTLQRVAEDCNLKCELLLEGLHFDYLAKITFGY